MEENNIKDEENNSYIVYHKGDFLKKFPTLKEAREYADKHAVSIMRPVFNPEQMLGSEQYEIILVRLLPSGKVKKLTRELYTTRIVLRK